MWRPTLALALMVSCSSPSPETIMDPEVSLPPAWSVAGSSEVATASDLLEVALDPKLKSLVQAALHRNLDLQVTALRLEEAAHLLGVDRAQRWPTLDATASAERVGLPDSSRTDVALGLRVQWELDVWGRIRAQAEASEARFTAQSLDYIAARRSLAARTLESSLDIILRRQLLLLERDRSQALQEDLEVVTDRFRRGLGPVGDFYAAEAALADAQVRLTQAADALDQAERALHLLLSMPELQDLDLPETLPALGVAEVSLPAQVLARRPDVGASMVRVRAAETDAEVAEDALLPSFQLTADLDKSGASLADALRADPVWTLLGSLTAPLLDGGRRAAEADAAAAALLRARVEHREVLVRALHEVETSLRLEESLTLQVLQMREALEAAEVHLSSRQDGFERGLVDILDLLQVRRQAFDARQGMLETRHRQAVERVNLALALGLEVV